MSDYYAKCAPLMPTHITQYRKLENPKFAAARDALSRLSHGSAKADPAIKISGENIELAPAKKRTAIYDYSWLPEKVAIGDKISLKDRGWDSKRKGAGVMMLKKKGYVNIGDCVFEFRGKKE